MLSEKDIKDGVVGGEGIIEKRGGTKKGDLLVQPGTAYVVGQRVKIAQASNTGPWWSAQHDSTIGQSGTVITAAWLWVYVRLDSQGVEEDGSATPPARALYPWDSLELIG